MSFSQDNGVGRGKNRAGDLQSGTKIEQSTLYFPEVLAHTESSVYSTLSINVHIVAALAEEVTNGTRRALRLHSASSLALLAET